MNDYQPWNDQWKNTIAYILISPKEWTPVKRSETFDYPIFADVISKPGEPRLMEFWKSVVDTMIFILGHGAEDNQRQDYVEWLREYDPHISGDLLERSKKRMDQSDPLSAVWMLQAAILMDPDQPEYHYQLGVAFSQYAMELCEKENAPEADLNFYQAIRYLLNAVELDAQMGKAFYSLGFVFRRLGLDEESRKCLEKYVLLGLEDGTYHSRGALVELL